MIYDYIIVGAGLGGISSGINLTLNDKKVLILEKNSLPGGLATTFKRGRFEFNTSLYDLYDYGNAEHIGTLKKIFDKYDVNIDTTIKPLNIKVKDLYNKENFTIKGNLDDFIVQLENMKNGSIEPLKTFIKITTQVHKALEELKKGNEVSEIIYPEFYKYINKNALDALTDLKIPKETIHRFGFLWLYLGSPLNKLNFIDFAEFMYKLIFKKTNIIKNSNLDLVLNLVNKYKEKGGKIYYRSEVTEINGDNDLKIITTKEGNTYKAKNVIFNLSQRYVYKNLIKDQNEKINKLENARTLSMNGVVVYLGLNKNHEEIGLNNYKYYHYHNINSMLNTKSMYSLYHNTWEAVVPNVYNYNASPKDTTILILKTNYFGNVFDGITKDNYITLKENIAADLISKFEQAFNIDIKEYIEEIEIATPITFSRYTNNVNGSMLGYMRLGYDNSIHRLISYEEEKMPNISFVGGSSIFGGGADNAIFSGYFITEKLLKDGVNNE